MDAARGTRRYCEIASMELSPNSMHDKLFWQAQESEAEGVTGLVVDFRESIADRLMDLLDIQCMRIASNEWSQRLRELGQISQLDCSGGFAVERKAYALSRATSLLLEQDPEIVAKRMGGSHPIDGELSSDIFNYLVSLSDITDPRNVLHTIRKGQEDLLDLFAEMNAVRIRMQRKLFRLAPEHRLRLELPKDTQVIMHKQFKCEDSVRQEMAAHEEELALPETAYDTFRYMIPAVHSQTVRRLASIHEPNWFIEPL